MTTKLTLPPLFADDETKARIYGVKFSVGPIEVEFFDEGAGTYVVIRMDLDGEWSVDPDEMLAFAAWIKETCNAIDTHNGHKPASQTGQANHNLFNPLYPGGFYIVT